MFKRLSSLATGLKLFHLILTGSVQFIYADMRDADQQVQMCRHSYCLHISHHLAHKNKKIQRNFFQESIASQIIRIHHECEGRIEKSAPRITVWHPWLALYPTLTGIIDSFSCSPLFFFYFKISFHKSLNKLRCNFT